MLMTHTDFGTDAGAHKRAKFNVTVLVLAQAILGSQMPMIFTIGGLAGQTLAPNPCYATLPISLIVLGLKERSCITSSGDKVFGK